MPKIFKSEKSLRMQLSNAYTYTQTFTDKHRH